jgi:hypothetical protein
MADLLDQIIGRGVEAIDVSKGYVLLTIQGGYSLNVCNDCELKIGPEHFRSNEIRAIEHLDSSIVIHFGTESRLTILTADKNYNGPEVYVLGAPEMQSFVYRGPE